MLKINARIDVQLGRKSRTLFVKSYFFYHTVVFRTMPRVWWIADIDANPDYQHLVR